MEFVTEVSDVVEGAVNLRGYSLEEVMRERPYADGAFLSIIGRLPDPEERIITDAVLNSLLDHGFVASTITAARYAASGNPQFVPAVAAGILAAGSNTLSPEHSFAMLERASDLRRSEGLDYDGAATRIVDEFRADGRRIPGLGHPIHKASDFRATVLFELMDKTGRASDGIAQFTAIHARFVEVTGKSGLPINIDGGLAAVGSDLGWSRDQVVAFAILSVLPGLMAHVIEEIQSNRPLRYITDGKYVGPSIRELP